MVYIFPGQEKGHISSGDQDDPQLKKKKKKRVTQINNITT